MVSLEVGKLLLTLRFLPPYADGDERDYLAALAGIGERTDPFMLLTLFGGGGRLSADGERAQALWFKATRKTLSERCLAIAIVRPDASRKMQETFQKLWPMPTKVFQDESEARDFLSSHAPAG
ncbi:hypothetical protein [Afipia clevelandensis]|uniref:STAS/SEC14 domain-containing protein n=1 Tax=Afipia clevelandensis ATCC 49720 TaxID=883079 RepID=K8NRX6_9BRAD|nr:hypothetical protein [Afipia clevelandensis]EKS31861.1 hypothetical protein HMPREF9696_04082 [Afipia clevelandensis ATCC 49720]